MNVQLYFYSVLDKTCHHKRLTKLSTDIVEDSHVLIYHILEQLNS